jgi:hypothetical protein
MACGVHLFDTRGNSIKKLVVRSPNYFVSPLLPLLGTKPRTC